MAEVNTWQEVVQVVTEANPTNKADQQALAEVIQYKGGRDVSAFKVLKGKTEDEGEGEGGQREREENASATLGCGCCRGEVAVRVLRT